MFIQIKQTLLDIGTLLTANQATNWASRLGGIAAGSLGAKDLEYLASASVWGSSGSLFDIVLSPANGNISDDFRRDNKHLSELLLSLLDELSGEGYHRPYFDACAIALQNRIRAYS